MGGASEKVKKTIKKAAKNVAKTVKDPTAEAAGKIAGATLNPLAGAVTFASRAAGVKTDALLNPIGTVAGEIGEKLVDKPKAEKEAFKRQQAAIESKNRRTLKDLKDRKAQEEAEEEAGEQLLRQRARQRRRRRGGTGRSSTILTENLGDAGGETTGRKTLLGM
jgi:hypothetical protein